MSHVIYDYDKCYELAKRCSSSAELRNLNDSAYNAALRNHWIKDYTWFVRKQHTPYTYEEVYEIAKNFTCSVDFQKGNGSAYGKARAKGWIKDYFWFDRKQHAPYTYEECFEIAREFDTRTDFAKGNNGAYSAALRHGWLEDYWWFVLQQRPNNYWTKERITEESRKYKSRSEFALGNGTAYGKARENGWLDEFTWLKDDRIDFSNGKIDCVYAYEFEDYHAVYVGRTLMRRIKERDYEHIFTENDSVVLFAKEHGIPTPSMKILEDNLTLSEGVKKEGYYLECYRESGWHILNRAKTGSIGKIAKDKWTQKKCYEEALKYSSRSEFADKNGSAYDAARRNGWLDSYTWFVEVYKPAGYWDNYDNCYEAALKCKNKSEFIKEYNRAWVIAKKNGWIDDYTWLNKKRVAHNKKWDYDSVYEEAKKYRSKIDFSRNALGAYKVAIANKWMESFDWFEETSVVHRKACLARKKKWTYEACRQLARESKGPLDVRRKSAGAYNAMWWNHWIDEFFPPKNG